MAVLSIESGTTVSFRAVGASYLDARNASVANSMLLNETTMQCGQLLQVSPPLFIVYRGAAVFDLSGLPDNADVTGATLKLYGSSDVSDTDFLLSVSDGNLNSPPTYSDYSTVDGPLGSFVTLNTSGFAVGSFNNFVFNSTGVAYINDAIQTGEVELSVRSFNDFASVPPTQSEFVLFKGQADSNRPVLEITYSDWPNEVYPTTPTFPAVGKIDLATYAVISDYLGNLSDDFYAIADNDGNITLGEDNWILWDTTSQKLAYDSVNDRVTFTSLDAGATTIVDVFADSMALTNNSSADNCRARVVQISDVGYASIKSQVTDNERVYSPSIPPNPITSDDEADLYMESTTGDFKIKTRDDGQAGTKTAILADFSGL
ncbi:hypothetical protein LCGC14_0853300 [marine sediment metagenome]|uniref:Uncharacterized protein n=1 Tax=marine sediment metagenome TaxID=412755 RepID=A0A0F9SGN5_9ZZZZ